MIKWIKRVMSDRRDQKLRVYISGLRIERAGLQAVIDIHNQSYPDLPVSSYCSIQMRRIAIIDQTLIELGDVTDNPKAKVLRIVQS